MFKAFGKTSQWTAAVLRETFFLYIVNSWLNHHTENKLLINNNKLFADQLKCFKLGWQTISLDIITKRKHIFEGISHGMQ